MGIDIAKIKTTAIVNIIIFIELPYLKYITFFFCIENFKFYHTDQIYLDILKKSLLIVIHLINHQESYSFQVLNIYYFYLRLAMHLNIFFLAEYSLTMIQSSTSNSFSAKTLLIDPISSANT